jgi:glycosyltransferase involved in cell wall biosynthesis
MPTPPPAVPADRPLRILVDVTTWVPGRTGVGLYTERVLRAWLGLGTGDQLIAASNVGHDELQGLHVTRVGPRFPVRALWMQTLLPVQALRLKPDFAFYPNYLGPLLPPCPYVLTVHDLAVFLYPETFTFKKRVLQRAALPTLVRNAAAILTPSESTRRDVLRLLPADPRRVVATPLAAADPVGPPPSLADVARIRGELHLPPRYLLAVGTLEPRKNLPRLIQAFEQIAGRFPDLHLVVAGGRGWRDDAIRAALGETPVRDRVHSVGYVDATSLRVLYAEALALCYPSLYEGFGLPVVEAMALGTPVLTSRGSSLDEVAAGAAVAVDPLSVEAIADGIEKLAGDAELRDDLRRRGLVRASELSWHRTALETRAVFARLAAGRLPRDEA